MVRGGMFSVILSVTWGLGPKCPRFREACCLLVFGLSSGATQVTPATTYHKPKRNTKNHAVPLAAFFARRNGPRAEGTAERSGEERCGRSRVKNGPRAEGAAERSWRRRGRSRVKNGPHAESMAELGEVRRATKSLC